MHYGDGVAAQNSSIVRLFGLTRQGDLIRNTLVVVLDGHTTAVRSLVVVVFLLLSSLIVILD